MLQQIMEDEVRNASLNGAAAQGAIDVLQQITDQLYRVSLRGWHLAGSDAAPEPPAAGAQAPDPAA